MMLESEGISDQPAHHDPGLPGIMPSIVPDIVVRRPDMVDDQTSQRAATDDQFTPKLPPPPPPVKGGVFGEAGENGKPQADQAERDGRKRPLLVEQRPVPHRPQNGDPNREEPLP